MRRDQILRQQPVISGNLNPADLPNPHEPVRSEETVDGHAVNWAGMHQQTVLPQEPSSLHKNSDELPSQQHTYQNPVAELTDGHNGHSNNTYHGEEQPHEAEQPAGKQHWLARMLHIAPVKSR
jgi:hypothetical protein